VEHDKALFESEQEVLAAGPSAWGDVT
jgi:hypothetical protein